MGLFENTDYWDDSVDSKVKSLQNKSKKLVKDKKIYRKYLEKQHNRVRSIDDLLGKLPKKNEQVRIITQKAFNAYAILLYIVEKHNIDECYLTTYNIDKNTIKGLNEVVNSGKIKKLTVLCSNSMISHNPKRAKELKEIASNKISVIFVCNHTKIILAKTSDNHYVIEGSGNVTANSRIEQYLFENCKDTYLFHSQWIKDIQSIAQNELEIYGGSSKK